MSKPFSAYMGDQRYVFVCYAHEDSPVVYRELSWLHEQGACIWYDEGITPGSNWRSEIGEALLGADTVLFFVSRQSLVSEHCNREINLALDEGKTVVPIYLEPVELTPDLKIGMSRLQAILVESGHEHRPQLLRAINVEPSTASKDRAKTETEASTTGWPGTLRVLLPTLIAISIGAWLVFEFQSPSETNPQFHIESLAVLPFRDRSQQSDLQWLADGIASDLTERLQPIAGIRVPSQSAVDRFRGSSRPPSEIAAELDVATLLIGYVNGTEQETKVLIEVIEPASGTVLWNTTSSGNSNQLLDMQRELVARVAAFLGLRIEQPGRMELPTGSAAYQAFLKYMYLEMTGRDFERREWIEKTLLLEPDFTYGHLQAAWTYQHLYSLTNDPELKDLARESLQRAESLGLGEDPQWENAWGGFLSRLDGRHADAELVLRRAAAEGAITQYAHLLIASGLVDEAAKALTVSTARYPYALANWGLLAAARSLQGDAEGMLSIADEMLRISPGFSQGLVQRHFALLQLGRFDQAEQLIVSLRESDPSPPGEFLADILTGYLFAYSNRPEETSVIAEKLLQMGAPMTAGLIYVAAGDSRGEELFGEGRPPFFINLPFYLSQLPMHVRSNSTITSAIESYGYTAEWRLELCHRVATMPEEAGIACAPERYSKEPGDSY